MGKYDPKAPLPGNTEYVEKVRVEELGAHSPTAAASAGSSAWAPHDRPARSPAVRGSPGPHTLHHRVSGEDIFAEIPYV